MDKITYKCKNCGWSKDIIAVWGDTKPIFCPNKKCEMSKEKSRGKKSFRKHPEALEVILPKKVKVKKEAPKKPVKKKVKKSSDGPETE